MDNNTLANRLQTYVALLRLDRLDEETKARLVEIVQNTDCNNERKIDINSFFSGMIISELLRDISDDDSD